MSSQQLDNLKQLRASIADAKKFFSMGAWEHCIWGHARRLAGRQSLAPWEISDRVRDFEQWAGVPGAAADRAFMGLFHDVMGCTRSSREDALTEIDHWIETYGPAPQEIAPPAPAAVQEELELVPA